MAEHYIMDASGKVCFARRVHSRLFVNRPSDLDEEQYTEHIHSLQSRSTSCEDVFICSYPKCGTHWVYDICQMLITKDVAEEPMQIYEFCTKDDTEALSKPMVIGTHLYPHELPHDILHNKCKLINVYRNPKDVAVSYYFFKADPSSQDTIPYKGNCSDYIQLFMEGKVQYNSYFDYIDVWKEFQLQHPGFVHVLFYEQLHLNPSHEIRRLGKFLGVDTSLIESNSFIENIANRCSFQTIKNTKKDKHSTEYQSFVERLWRKDLVKRTYCQLEDALIADEVGEGGHPRIVQKEGGYPWMLYWEWENHTLYKSLNFKANIEGTVGDWKNYFTVAQNDDMDRLIQKRLHHHDISFVYDIPQTKK